MGKIDVKRLREERGLSQQQLADMTGIPKGRINGWEQRGNSPKLEDYEILKNFFGLGESKGSHSPPDASVPAGDHIALLNRYLAFMENEVLFRLKRIDVNSEIAATYIRDIAPTDKPDRIGTLHTERDPISEEIVGSMSKRKQEFDQAQQEKGDR